MSNSTLTPKVKTDLVALYRQAIATGQDINELDLKLSKHITRQKVTAKINNQDVKAKEEKLVKSQPWWLRLGALVVPAGFVTLGIFLLGNALLPIANYYVNERGEYVTDNYVSPIPDEDILKVAPVVLASSKDVEEEEEGPIILDTKLDYTNLANWFPQGNLGVLSNQDEMVFTIDIPAVDIEGAEVKIGGTNLNENLIQYPGTAMPGELGAPVIFGHSVLRQFYNPSVKNPRRYNSIFSYIMTLKAGDKIYITHNNVKYTYSVTSKTEVKPEDVHILTQDYSAKQLKLVTCTPEGTYLRRGVVMAELIDS